MASAPKKYQIYQKKINNLDFSHVNALKMVRSSYLVDSSFEATNMENIKVRHSTFKKINLKKCILIRSRFAHSDLEQCNFEYANLSQNSFFRTALRKTNLQCTSFRNSTFNECTLAHADLRWANLEGAAFVKSNLSKVNFCNSNMTNVKFMKCNLKGATYNIHTVLPFNQEHASGLGMVFVH